jgi:hypothetical protein
MENVPDCDGTPSIDPIGAYNANPGGNDPDVIDQV